MGTTYALMRNGRIINTVTTVASQEEVERRFKTFDVKPIDEVPLSVRQAYKYWDERP
ncbi:hypothetical protein BI081_gp090 [Mycobacterium phage Tonenili]|uniref:Uncharacterized protein n=1 Tax=Mycobacterium phage Tonenili TaxID=1891703 RepID=A0A1C9EH82_9CAUD|nr:hypothetical protein BI081_gp090 [Mycobacterium phage Tonenili]AON96841.1 hypothetical protein SEA_TONENILI_90 [Mycobacterium phage Tonenili]